jgi:hypothetical protein
MVHASTEGRLARRDGRRGVLLVGHVLGPLSDATLRMRRGELTVGDGPVSEQTHQIPGFDLAALGDPALR